MPTKSPSSPFDRRRWTEADARLALAALDRSGKAVSVFAAEHGLDPQRLYVWRRRLGKAELTTFQELIVRPATPITVAASNATFEIVLRSGELLRVPPSFDAASLERLLAVLRADAC
jgi:transposase-like protein